MMSRFDFVYAAISLSVLIMIGSMLYSDYARYRFEDQQYQIKHEQFLREWNASKIQFDREQKELEDAIERLNRETEKAREFLK